MIATAFHAVRDVRSGGAAAFSSEIVFRGEGFDLLRLALPAGKQLPSHRAPGEIVIQCLEGEVEITAADQQYELRDLFSLRLRGKDEAGKLITALEPTGQLPTFAQLPYEHGLDDQVRHSSMLWEQP